jgi:hypothetical protein
LSLITLLLACPFQLDGSLYEVEAASASDFFQVAFLYGEEAALVRAVFVDTAGGRAVAVLFEEGALEQYLAASAAAVTVAAPQGQLLHHLFFAKVDSDEAAQLPLRLPRA